MKTTNKISSFISSLVIAFAITLSIPSTSHAGFSWKSNSENSTKNLDSSGNLGLNFGAFRADCGMQVDICGKTFPIGFLPLLKTDFTKKLIGLEVGREYTLTFYNMNMGFDANGEISDTEGWKMNIGGNISIIEEDTLTFTFTATASTTLIKITPKASAGMHFSLPLGFKVTCGEIQATAVCGTVYEDTDNSGDKNNGEVGVKDIEVKICYTKKVDNTDNSQLGFGFNFGAFQADCGMQVDICGKTFPIGFLPLLKTDFTKKLIGLEVGREYTLTFYNMNMGFDANGEISDTEGWKMNIGGNISIIEEDTLTFTFTATASTTLIKITPKASAGMHFSLPLGFKVTCGEISNTACIVLKTDDKGNYCTTEVPEGEANVTVNRNTLPNGSTLTAGINPNTFTVVSMQRNNAGDDGYTFPLPVGTIHGTVYEDYNGNNKKDNNEKGVENITVTILDSEGNTFIIVTNSRGEYNKDGIAEGEATVTIHENTLPQYNQLTTADSNPSIVNVISHQDNNAGDDGYIFLHVDI